MQTLTPQQLFAADYGLQGPFIIDLQDGSSLAIEKVLRHLPGKRVACQAVWNGATVFAKIFNPHNSNKSYIREQEGYELIKSSGIKAPLCIERKCLPSALLVCYEFLEEDGGGIDIQRALVLLGALHKKNLIHQDIHTGNLMSAGGELYLLDMGAVVAAGNRASKISNLALFIAQFSLDRHEELVSQKKFYEDSSGLSLSAPYLIESARVLWEKRKKTYLKKIFRNSTETIALKKFHLSGVIKRKYYTPAMEQTLKNLHAVVEGGRLLKDGNSQTVVGVDLDNYQMVIKRYNQKSWRHAAKRWLGYSRAKNCWKCAHLLKLIGIETAEPIAYIKAGDGTTYYACKLIEGTSVRRQYRMGQISIEYLNPLLKKLFLLMHKAHLVHGDMKTTNLFVVGGKLALIDLDVMAENPFNYKYRRKKDERRFWANFEGD